MRDPVLESLREILAQLDAAYVPNNPVGPAPAELLAAVESAQQQLAASSARVGAVFAEIDRRLNPAPLPASPPIKPLRVGRRRKVKTA